MKHISIFEAFSNPSRFGTGNRPTSDYPHTPEEIMSLASKIENNIYAVAFVKGDEEKIQTVIKTQSRSTIARFGDVRFLHRMLGTGVVFLISGEGSADFRYLVSVGERDNVFMDLEGDSGNGKTVKMEDLLEGLKITESELGEVLEDAIAKKKETMMRQLEKDLKVGSDFVNSLG